MPLADIKALRYPDERSAMSMFDVTTRQVAASAVLGATRRAHGAELGAVLGELLGTFSQAGDGVPGLNGCPYVVYYAEVSEDSDGPVQLVRPMVQLSVAQAVAEAEAITDVQARTEPAHAEILVRLTKA